MILAGIDEAGYGPVLGPLVVGCAAVELPGDDLDAVPCGWKVLRRAIAKSRDASGKRLHVNDSKKVYSPAAGLGELEKSVLAMANACHGAAGDLSAFVVQCAGESSASLDAIDWYRAPAGEVFPIECEAMSISLSANKLRHELGLAKVNVAKLHAHVVPEDRLNEMFDATRNKGATSFSFVAQHLDALLNAFADRGLVIYCDRQGGRERYGGLLMQMFEDWSLEVIGEAPERSEYRLSQGDRAARLIFAEQAEQQCVSVALASMLSKYLREALMRRFNAYWRTHLPDVKPTAGYWTDGLRFLDDIHAKLNELGIDAARLTRSR